MTRCSCVSDLDASRHTGIPLRRSDVGIVIANLGILFSPSAVDFGDPLVYTSFAQRCNLAQFSRNVLTTERGTDRCEVGQSL